MIVMADNVSRGTLPPALFRWGYVGANADGLQVFERHNPDHARVWISRDMLAAGGQVTDAWLDEILRASITGKH